MTTVSPVTQIEELSKRLERARMQRLACAIDMC